ncbi:MAG: AmmeMemoRadiSam system radical SAM enzyme [Candidatus Bathyarchaeia archaeon]
MSLGVGSISENTRLEAFSVYATVKEALFYKRLDGDRVKCSLCERKCEIVKGGVGFCRTRRNFGGKLYTLVYGDISAVESRPIEIKPFFHYWPGSKALTFSTWSCNFDCAWCQNYHLSKATPDPAKAVYYSPEKIVELALAYGDAGLCASFQEPTLLTEWVIQAFSLGKRRGLKYCCYVSNGYMTIKALKALRDAGMDGLKIDVKGDHETYMRYCSGADVEKVWRNAAEAKRLGLHVEVVNLVISGVNDSENTLQWVIEKHLKHVGPEAPLHFTRYFPAYKFHNPPTKVEVLEKAYEMARKAGVLYPYIGNVIGHKYENTHCPTCGEKLIMRYGYYVLKYAVTEDKRCPKCGTRIPIIGQYLGR